MKKISLVIIMIFVNIFYTYSQQLREKVGDNPTIIESSAVLEVQSTNKGMLFPRVALTSTQDNTTITSPQVSLLVYNTATSGVYPNDVTPGFYYWDGLIWARFYEVVLPIISSINCQDAIHNGTLSADTEANGVSSIISYIGGNGGIYGAQSIASTGVTGLKASLSEGRLPIGAGSLVYTITGTPSAAGTASFEIIIGGQTCTLHRIVGF